MALGSCYSCVKYLMFAFNFLFWLLGCAILGIGIWILVDPNFKDYVNTDDKLNFLYTGAYILISVGAIIMVIGFLGCCGAIRESQWMLSCFFIFLFVIFGLLLAVGIWAVVEKDSLKTQVRTMLLDAVDHYEEPERKKFVDNIQTKLHCCGANGAEDYKDQRAPCEPDTLDKGCADKVFEFMSKHVIVIAGITIGIGVVMLLGMVFAMCLCCEIRRGGEDKY